MKPKPQKRNALAKVFVSLSGGIDSTACAAFYLQRGFSVRAVFVDYGQIAARREEEAAKAVARNYQIHLLKLRWSGLSQKNAGLITGRNAFLLFAAFMEMPEDVRILALGIHSGTQYRDCSPLFIRKVQSLFDTYTGGRLQIGAPFLKWTKADIWTYCRSQGVPVELTYSCERGQDQPCGQCLSCRDLEALNAYA